MASKDEKRIRLLTGAIADEMDSDRVKVLAQELIRLLSLEKKACPVRNHNPGAVEDTVPRLDKTDRKYFRTHKF